MNAKTLFAAVKAYLVLTAVVGLLLIPTTGLAASISCGQTVSDTTTSASQIDQYTYVGSAGQVLSFALWGPASCNSGGDTTIADIYNPSGQLVASLSSGCGGAAMDLTLTNTGTFTILVHESAYRRTVSYQMSLQSVTGGGCNGKAIACGQTVGATTTFNSEMDSYSYAGTAGQMISVALWGPASCNSGGDTTIADIYNPSGQLVASLSSGCGGAAMNLTLANSGTFTILVHESSYQRIVSYQMSLQSVTGGGCNGKAIACGQTVGATTTFNSEMDSYSYAGTAGQMISVALWGPANCNSGGDTTIADIYNPNGQLVASLSSGCGGAAMNLTLTNSGTFTILVHESSYQRIVSYQMSLQSVTGGGCNGQAILCGQTVGAATTFNSEMDSYSYAGTAGQMISVALWGPANCNSGGDTTIADIYNPSGQLVASLSSGCGGAAMNLTLTNSGTFTILVHESAYQRTVSYQMSIQSVTGGGCDSTPIACGQTVNTNTIYRSEMDAYGFVTSGGTVIFSFSGYGGARFDLHDPMGNTILTVSPGTGPSTNLVAGTYTILVHDVNYAGTGNYGFTVTCIGSPCNPVISPTGPVSVGASATTGTVLVTNGSGCAWTAAANTNWLHITSGSSGTGNGTVSYSVDANVNPGQRSATLTIAGYTVIVNQANPVVFSGQDIGAPGAPGSFSYSNGTYTVNGSGEGTDGSADIFYFAYQTLAGDAQIMARLQSLQGGDPHLAEAGIMIRESLDPGSKQASLSVNVNTNVIFRRRLAANSLGIQYGFQGTNYLQGTNYIWLRLMRMGNTFVAHYSTNGLNWQYMWFTTMTMSNQVQVGLAVTAHHYGQLATAKFDNVSTGGLTPLPGLWPLPGPLLLLGGQNWSPAEFQRIGGYEFLLGGVVGEYENIKSTTNIAAPFSSWPSLATVTNTYGVLPIFDPGASTNQAKYYRAQKIGP